MVALVGPISPMRCVLIVDNRRGCVGDRGWTTSWIRTHFATIGAQGWRVVEAPEPHAVSRDAFAELAEYAFVGVHGADPHLVDGPVVPFAIRTTHRAVCVNIVVSSGLVMCRILCAGVAAPSAARDP